jgi:hypothetical protein
MEKNKIEIQLNYFGPFLSSEEIDDFLDETVINPETIWSRELMQALFNIPSCSISKEVLERYVEATTKDSHTSIVPHSEKIAQKLLEPLKSAKKSYCLGDYLATIALCGMTAEMMTVLIWEINNITLKGKKLSKKQEKRLFGKKFINLNQYRRLEILKIFNLVSENQFKSFDDIRTKRNEYLHSWVISTDDKKNDSLNMFKGIFKIFMEITDVGIGDPGKVKMDQKILNYLNKKS